MSLLLRAGQSTFHIYLRGIYSTEGLLKPMRLAQKKSSAVQAKDDNGAFWGHDLTVSSFQKVHTVHDVGILYRFTIRSFKFERLNIVYSHWCLNSFAGLNENDLQAHGTSSQTSKLDIFMHDMLECYISNLKCTGSLLTAFPAYSAKSCRLSL